MPYKPKKPCAYPLCPNLAEDGSSYCSAHSQSAPKYNRQSSAKRGYDRYWQKLRDMHLKEYHLCQMCREMGVIRQAELVHHKQTINEKPDLRLYKDNLVSLCRDCHAKERKKSKG